MIWVGERSIEPFYFIRGDAIFLDKPEVCEKVTWWSRTGPYVIVRLTSLLLTVGAGILVYGLAEEMETRSCMPTEKKEVNLTFDTDSAEFVLDCFDKAVDGEGYVVERGNREQKVLTTRGEEIKRSQFGGIRKGSAIFIKSDIESVIDTSDLTR